MSRTLEHIRADIEQTVNSTAARQRFDEKASRNLTYAADWNLEGAVKEQALAERFRPMLGALAGGVDAPTFLSQARDYLKSLERELFMCPWRHNSTSAISNVIKAWEAEALVDAIKQIEQIVFWVDHIVNPPPAQEPAKPPAESFKKRSRRRMVAATHAPASGGREES